MIKILFLTHTFDDGGVERNTFQLINTFNQNSVNNFDIRVVSLLGKGPFYDPAFCQCLMPVALNVQKMRKSKWILYPLILIFLPYLVYQLNQYLKKERPNIICTNMWLADILGIWIGHKNEYKTIAIQHDIVKINPLFAWLKRKSLRSADQIVAVSNCTKTFLINYFKTPESKITVIYNGVDYNKFEYSHKNLEAKALVLGTVAKLDKIKRHIDVLNALLILRKRKIQLPPYIIVGNGPENTYLQGLVKKHGLDNVKFVGEVTDINPWLKQIDIFILPSISEGLGIAVIEAMIAKKIIIGSDIEALRELIINQQTGLLLPPRNPALLADAIDWTLTHPLEAQNLAEAAYDWIYSHYQTFSNKVSADQYRKLFLA